MQSVAAVSAVLTTFPRMGAEALVFLIFSVHGLLLNSLNTCAMQCNPCMCACVRAHNRGQHCFFMWQWITGEWVCEYNRLN